MNANTPAIRIKNFQKRYDSVYAVKDLNLEVRLGTFFGFVGPNGAGKSTTINAMAGLLKPSGGTIEILGYDISKDPLQAKKQIGFMPETVVLYERMSAREYLDFVGRMYEMPSGLIQKRCEELLSMLDLDGNKLMEAFSLGMRKKAALAAAIIHSPPIVILDEPFSGIDATTSSKVRQTLKNMVDEGKTVFFSSHILETVERISREIGIIHQGKLLSCGTLDEVRRDAGCGPDSSLEDVFLTLVGAKEIDMSGSLTTPEEQG